MGSKEKKTEETLSENRESSFVQVRLELDEWLFYFCLL